MTRMPGPTARRCLLATIAVVAICNRNAFSQEDNSGKRTGKIIIAVDVFLPGNAGDELFNDVQKAMGVLANAGYASSGSVATKAALGGRAGYLFRAANNYYIGPSFGYISGPDSTATLLVSGGGRSATLTDKRGVGFFRGLLEQQLLVPLGDQWFLNLGAGIGVAAGNVDETLQCIGSACTTSGSTTKNSAEWTGFTWEISPGISFRDFFLAFRYAGFPAFGGKDPISAMHWRAPGIVTGWAF